MTVTLSVCPLAEGVIVLFSANGGVFLDPVIQETDVDGKAVVDLDTTGGPADTSTVITVTGTARGQADSVTVRVNPSP